MSNSSSCRPNTNLKKVISGGQTGADLAAPIAARAVGISTGGTAPAGYQTEVGENLDLRDVYGLIAEGTNTTRTKKNVDDADATLVLLIQENPVDGSTKTIGWASNHQWEDYFESKLQGGHRPLLVMKADDLEVKCLTKSALKIVEFIKDSGVQTLNVAGHRQSTAFLPTTANSDRHSYDYEKRCVDLLSMAFQIALKGA